MIRLLALILCLGSWSTAGADVVGPDVRTCPSGFPHKRCHGAEYCEIPRCTDSAQCPSGSSCAEQRWCVWKLDCGERLRSDGYVPNYYYGYEGSCANGEACTKGSCETIRACTPQPQPAERGCSCAVAGPAAPPSLAPALLLGLLVLAALGRRRWTSEN